MPALRFSVTGSAPDLYGAAPAIKLDLKVNDDSGCRVHTVALRCQLRIETKKRKYSDNEAEKVVDLFGEPSRWSETLNPLQLANVSAMVPSFTGEITVPLEIPLTFDTELASTKYMRALEGGEIPLLLLFSGTCFYQGASGVQLAQVPWHEEATHRLPISVWRTAMEVHFAGMEWMMVRRATMEALSAYRSERAIPNWEETIERLLKEAGVGT